MHTLFSTSGSFLFSHENVQRVNKLLSDIEIQIEDRVIAVDSIQEFFKKFECFLTFDAAGNVTVIHQKSSSFKKFRATISSLVEFMEDGSHLFPLVKETKRHFTVRNGKLVRIYAQLAPTKEDAEDKSNKSTRKTKTL